MGFSVLCDGKKLKKEKTHTEKPYATQTFILLPDPCFEMNHTVLNV
jgi:hypothetical protein